MFMQLVVLFSIYHVLLVFGTVTSNNQETCNCTLLTTALNTTQDPYQLRCHQGHWEPENRYQFACQRVGDLVRVGPPSDVTYARNEEGNDIVVHPTKIQLAPWAFSDLISTVRNVTRLQLDLPLATHETNALSLAGLDDMRELLTRTSTLQWDHCSFANLPRLEQLLLNCKSGFPDFLHLSPAIRMVRFVDCEEVPLQFYCTRCLQDPKVHVIRIRPGPPLRQYMIKFSQFSPTPDPDTTTNVSSSSRIGHLSIGHCVPNMCSDQMLCRDNQPLHLARAKWGKPKETEIPTTTTIITTLSTSLIESTLSTLESITTLASVDLNLTTNQSEIFAVMAEKQMQFPDLLRLLIGVSVLAFGIVILLTVCVLIGIARQRSQQAKFTPSIRTRRSNATQNGSVTSELPVMLVSETKGESAESVSV